MKMKLLVIGKEGRLRNLSKPGKTEQAEIVYLPADAETEQIVLMGKDADVVLIDAMSRLSGEAMSQMPNLKMIHSEGVGFQGVDVEAAAKLGIYVCNCKGMNASAVAEHTILLMLACLRDLVNGNWDVLSARQIEKKEKYMTEGSLHELSDCRIGLVGFGDIAKETARLAEAFGAEVVYYNRSEVPEEKRRGAMPLSLEELLKTSDIVSVHLAVTPQTRRFADETFFSEMKEGAYFINASRGDLVDSAALIQALQSGKLAGAGLDCIEGEPVKPENVFLQASEDVKRKIIFSPHIGGITVHSFRRGYEIFWDNFEKIQRGERPINIVNQL